MAKSTRGLGRTRNWNFIVYPESCIENWREILNETRCEWVESPLHDKDINATGETKKAHYHCTIMFESVKTYEQVNELMESIQAPIPQKCNSVRGSVRYMCHLDNPDKYQYSKNEVIGHNGADVLTLLKPLESSRYEIISEMTDFIVQNDITEFEELFVYSRFNQRDDWFPLLCDSSAYIINTFIKSRRNRKGRALNG